MAEGAGSFLQRVASPVQRAVWACPAGAPKLGSLKDGFPGRPQELGFRSSNGTGETQMRNLVGGVVLVFVCAGSALAGNPEATSSGGADSLRRVDQDFGDAIMRADLDKLNQIIADDYRGIGYSGRPADKASVLDYVKSGKSRLEWFELGPRDVKMLGDDVAVVQATVNEKRNEAGVTVS